MITKHMLREAAHGLETNSHAFICFALEGTGACEFQVKDLLQEHGVLYSGDLTPEYKARRVQLWNKFGPYYGPEVAALAKEMHEHRINFLLLLAEAYDD